MRDLKKKFILVDPSFDGVTGDKWQYAVTFAKSAIANGYDFILLAAENAPSIASAVDGEIIEKHIFKYTFYQHSEIISRHVSDIQKMRKFRQLRNLKKLNAEIESARSEGDEAKTDYWTSALNAEKERQHAEFAESVLLRNKIDPLPVPFNRDDFAIALGDALRDLKVGEGDKLFLHTATPAMLESLQEVTAHLNLKAPFDIDAYFLFHFGMEAPDARTFLDRYHSYSHMQTVAGRVKIGAPFARNYFLATSEILAEECRELFQVPVGVFDGLTDLDTYVAANGGAETLAEYKRKLHDQLVVDHSLEVSVRAADLSAPILSALKRAEPMLARLGVSLQLNILFHSGSAHHLQKIIQRGEPLKMVFADVNDNAAYNRAIARTHVMLLSYDAERYKKRVSAVLHDCSVLSTPCIVPAGSTLADSHAYSRTYVYQTEDDLPGVLIRSVRDIELATEERTKALNEVALERYASDVVGRLTSSLKEPSVTVDSIGPVALVVCPAWGRCGSSLVIEGQLKFLQDLGYFIIQIFVMDKAEDQERATAYFWSLLRENSENIRGCVQRIAFPDAAALEALMDDENYLRSNGFSQYSARIAAGTIGDAAIERLARSAELTLVNHSFNAEFGRKYGGGRFVLESHDVQSYQMAKWPIVNDATGRPEPINNLIAEEFRRIADFDFVVNLASEEHQMLSIANKRSKLVYPYIPVRTTAATPQFATVGELAKAWDLHPVYEDIEHFDILLSGDSHRANVESGIWFIKEVFLPYLAPRNVYLAIVGRLSDILLNELGDIPNVFYMGFVPDVYAVRMLSHVSVLPDRRGTGISIKTLETFAAGSAFVATSTAVRGFKESLPAEVEVFDDPNRMAKEIERLIYSAEALQESRELAKRCHAVIASEERLFGAWTEVMHNIGLSADGDTR